MTTVQKNEGIRMRKSGLGYTKIAEELGISKNTVKSFCRRNRLAGEAAAVASADTQEVKYCLHCGRQVMQNPGRKEKKFCSDLCRNRYWNSHLDQVQRKAMYEYTCPTCGAVFHAYGNRNRKYCSHKCYIEARFGGAACE